MESMKRFTRPEAAVFLSLESSERPMHFSALQLFRPPQGSGPEFARNTFEAMRAHRDVAPAYAGHPATTRGGTSRLRWTYDDCQRSCNSPKLRGCPSRNSPTPAVT
ncbi:MAG: wax ester/triacylglycerol synthase domain-containing protein [Mycobacterium sp.]